MEKLMWREVFGKSLQQLYVRVKGLSLGEVGKTSSQEVIP